MSKFTSLGTWYPEHWRQAWAEIAWLCEGLLPDDPRMPRVLSYLEVFDQEYQWRDAEWFAWALNFFRNGFPEKRQEQKP